MAENKELREREKLLIAEALRIESANARQDSVRQKNRAAVRGGGAKPWRQKGTGRARQGSIRSVHWVGGGRAFGAAQENHHRKINKKVRRKALSEVFQWLKDSGRVLIDDFSFETPSTKKFIAFLDGKEISGKVLLLHDGGDAVVNAVKSARNLANVTLLHADAVNLQALLNTEWLLTTPGIAERLNLTNG